MHNGFVKRGDFLFLPVGGFQGGRNPYYGIVIFFERHTWGDIHTWSSVVIMALAALEEAFAQRSGWMAFLQVEPMLDGLRDDPRFEDLLARVGHRG